MKALRPDIKVIGVEADDAAGVLVCSYMRMSSYIYHSNECDCYQHVIASVLDFLKV